MKDLFILTADSDAQAFIDGILSRERALQIRPISFEIQRLPSRDAGMAKDGPELARMMVGKSDYARLILMWDHHGSGREAYDPADVEKSIQARLNSSTWSDRSFAVILVPELEEWLWHNPNAVGRHVGLNQRELETHLTRFEQANRLDRESCFRTRPKELFGFLMYAKQRRRPLPEDFSAIARRSSVNGWRTSNSFAALHRTLRKWFPP